MGLPFTTSWSLLGVFIFLWILVHLFSAIAVVPYMALIPDLVPARQFGAASGYIGLMTMFGAMVGAVVTGAMLQAVAMWAAYLLNCGFVVVGAGITLLTLNEPLNIRPLPSFNCRMYVRETLKPFRNFNFSLVFWTRLFALTAYFTLLEFFPFYLRDTLTVYSFFQVQFADFWSAYAFWLFIALLGSLGAAILTGTLSDRFGRRILVLVSGVLQVVPLLVITFVRTYIAMTISGFFVGVGVGVYVTVSWALACDVVPSHEHARDMGVWSAASVVPHIVAAPVVGLLVDHLNRYGLDRGFHYLGYIVVFCITAVLCVLGTAPTLAVQEPSRILVPQVDPDEVAVQSNDNSDESRNSLDIEMQFQHDEHAISENMT